MTVRSKRQKITFTSKTGVEVEFCYCRKCMQTKSPNEFYVATDLFLDANGFFSVCKACCNDLYERILRNEGSVERALLKTCRLLNIKYDKSAIISAQSHLEKMALSGKKAEGFFGLYKSKLTTLQKTNIGDKSPQSDLTFEEPSEPVPLSELDQLFVKDNEDLEYFWGSGLTKEDYIFLELELSEWKSKHKCDTKAEEMLLKEICLTSLSIRKRRNEAGSTKDLVKELQELMKTASVDPAKASVAGSGRSQDAFSSFIKTIEETDPADYYEDKELFKDFDNIGPKYFIPYVTRPLKNFITQSRDFNVEEEDVEDDEEMGFIGNAEATDGFINSTLEE